MFHNHAWNVPMRSTRRQEIQTLLSTILSTNFAVQPFDDYHQCESSGTTPNPVATRGPMLRYIFLSVFALLLLTACGGNDLDQLKKDKFCSECDLSGADLTGVNLRGAEIRRADLSGANLRGANLSEAKLTEADLSGANLTDANLEEAYLVDADLTDANLTGTDLRGANLYGVIGADFTGALNVPEGVLAMAPGAQYFRDTFLFQVLKFLIVIFGSLGIAYATMFRKGQGFATRGNLNGKEILLVFVVTFVLLAGYFYVLNP